MANSAELIVYTALKGLVPVGDGKFRCYADIAPLAVAKPYITYQAVGGQSEHTLNGGPGIANARMQINVWADSRSSATALMTSVKAALEADPINAVPIGRPVSEYEADTKLYGSRLDFSIWYYP